jgi:hypothetical protein
MDCGIPFCHTGVLLSGMACGCPINNLIPEWNDLIYRDLWKQALERLHRTGGKTGVIWRLWRPGLGMAHVLSRLPSVVALHWSRTRRWVAVTTEHDLKGDT